MSVSRATDEGCTPDRVEAPANLKEASEGDRLPGHSHFMLLISSFYRSDFLMPPLHRYISHRPS